MVDGRGLIGGLLGLLGLGGAAMLHSLPKLAARGVEHVGAAAATHADDFARVAATHVDDATRGAARHLDGPLPEPVVFPRLGTHDIPMVADAGAVEVRPLATDNAFSDPALEYYEKREAAARSGEPFEVEPKYEEFVLRIKEQVWEFTKEKAKDIGEEAFKSCLSQDWPCQQPDAKDDGDDLMDPATLKLFEELHSGPR